MRATPLEDLTVAGAAEAEREPAQDAALHAAACARTDSHGLPPDTVTGRTHLQRGRRGPGLRTHSDQLTWQRMHVLMVFSGLNVGLSNIRTQCLIYVFK